MTSGSWERNQEALQDAIRLCNEQHPDLAVFTGDLVNSRADEMKDLMPVFSQLKAKDGVYSILGNHDYATYTHWNHFPCASIQEEGLVLRIREAQEAAAAYYEAMDAEK